MPKIIRWFKVSHDLNSDPEVWELTERFGDRALRVWLEMLSIADRNAGIVGPDSDYSRIAIACKSRMSRIKVGLIFDWCLTKGWLVSDKGLRIAKWLKFNKARVVTEIPHGKLASPPPIRDTPIRDNTSNKIKRGSQYPENFEVSEYVRTWARAKGLPDPELHLEAFRDYHVSKRSVFSDWDAALRTWMRNVGRFNGKDPARIVGQERPRPVPPLMKRGPIAPEPTKEERKKIQGLLHELSEKLSS